MCPIMFFFLGSIKRENRPLSQGGRFDRYKTYISYKSYTNFDGQKSQYSCVFREEGGDKISCLGGQNFLLGGTKFRSLIFTFAILGGQNIVLELKNYRYN